MSLMITLEDARTQAAEDAGAAIQWTDPVYVYLQKRHELFPFLASETPNARRMEADVMCSAWRIRYAPHTLPPFVTDRWIGSWLCAIVQGAENRYLFFGMACAMIGSDILKNILQFHRKVEIDVYRTLVGHLYNVTTDRHVLVKMRNEERTPYAQARMPRFLLSRVKERGLVDLIGQFVSGSITPMDPVLVG